MCQFLLFNLVIVFLIGCICGTTEVLSRYKESKYIFKKAIFGWVALYITFNGLVSILALFFIKYFRGQESAYSFTEIELNNILIAGFGGMMILRSSIFSIKNNGKEVAIGLESIVKTFLDSIERQIKNIMATKRLDDLDEIMKGLDFEKIKEELPLLCIDFVDNFKKEDSDDIKNHIANLANYDKISNFGKCLTLGRKIAEYCDTQIIKSMIEKNVDFKLTNEEIDLNPNQEIEDLQNRLRN